MGCVWLRAWLLRTFSRMCRIYSLETNIDKWWEKRVGIGVLQNQQMCKACKRSFLCSPKAVSVYLLFLKLQIIRELWQYRMEQDNTRDTREVRASEELVNNVQFLIPGPTEMNQNESQSSQTGTWPSPKAKLRFSNGKA